MEMLERILIPLDGSLRAELILGQLGPFLRSKDSRVLLLRVLDEDVPPWSRPRADIADRSGRTRRNISTTWSRSTRDWAPGSPGRSLPGRSPR